MHSALLTLLVMFAPAKVTFELPDAWTMQDAGDHLVITSPDKSATVTLTAVTGDVDAAWDGVAAGLSVTKVAGAFGGMVGYVAAGTDATDDILVAAVTAPVGTLTVVAHGTTGVYEKDEPELMQIFQTLGPAGGDNGLAQDAAFLALPADAQTIAGRVVELIQAADAEGFLELVAKKQRKKIAKAITDVGGLTAYLAFPATGRFYVTGKGKKLTLTRGTATLHLVKVKKVWQVQLSK